jgi:hypothetical protein
MTDAGTAVAGTDLTAMHLDVHGHPHRSEKARSDDLPLEAWDDDDLHREI